MATIRELISERSIEVRSIEQLNPHRASEILVELTSLLASLNAEIVEAQYWFNIKKQEFFKESGVAAKAKIEVDATKEWKDWQDRVMQGKALEEMIRSIKYYLRNAETENRESRF